MKKKLINTETKCKNASKIIHRTNTESETETEKKTIPYRRNRLYEIIILKT